MVPPVVTRNPRLASGLPVYSAPRGRTSAAKRFKRVERATALIWKLLMVAEKRFRKLNAPHLLQDVWEGRTFEDGRAVSDQARKDAA
jgi:putative transposase